MRHTVWKWRTLLAVPAAALVLVGFSRSQAPEDFETVRKRMEQAKPAVQKKHADLLALRYDLSNRPAKDLTMSRGKAVQIGPRAKLHGGMTWKTLAALSPEEIKAKGLFPKGFRQNGTCPSEGLKLFKSLPAFVFQLSFISRFLLSRPCCRSCLSAE